MDEPVTSFPFNVLNDPMYVGSTMCFLGLALLNSSLQGLVLTVLIWITYRIAILFEGRYTRMIYAEREAKKAKMH